MKRSNRKNKYNFLFRLKIWLSIKKLFYRYNLKNKKPNGEFSTVEEILTNMLKIYTRLPNKERKLMEIKVQNIVNAYKEEILKWDEAD